MKHDLWYLRTNAGAIVNKSLASLSGTSGANQIPGPPWIRPCLDPSVIFPCVVHNINILYVYMCVWEGQMCPRCLRHWFTVLSTCGPQMSFLFPAHSLFPFKYNNFKIKKSLHTTPNKTFFLIIFKHLLWHECYSKVKPRTISFPQLATGSCAGSGKLHLTGSPSLQILRKKKKRNSENWAPNPITQDAVFQCLPDTPLSKSSTLCVKSIPSVCGEFAPLLALLCRHMLGFMMPLDARSASSPSLTY